jgi:hypothetical protein
MIHTFIVQIKKRDDLPDTEINSALLRHILEQGAWLDIVDIDELPTITDLTTTNH